MTSGLPEVNHPARAGSLPHVHVALRSLSNPWFWMYVTCAVFGGLLVWVVGHRGIYLYDQSGVFDGGWRMLQGQVMYRDFFAPYGPMVFWIQSWFFRFAGVSFSSMVLSAAVMNAVAALCAIRLVRRLLPEPVQRVTAIGAGLLTAFWFQAPSGTLWFEQTGFCFNLMATTLLVEGRFRSNRVAACLRVAAGMLLTAAVLSKQTAGVVLLPVPLGVAVIAAVNWKKGAIALLHVIGGIALGSAIFLTWLWTRSSISGFWESVVVMSRVLGSSRLGLVSRLTDLVLLTATFKWIQTALATILASALIAPRAFRRRETLSAAWIAVGYLVLQNVFATVTFNEAFNSLGFLGVINGLSFGLLMQAVLQRRAEATFRATRLLALAVLVPAALLLFGVSMIQAWRVDVNRNVQQFNAQTFFTDGLRVPRASRLRWGEPTILEGARVRREDFEALNAWLAASNVNFFIFNSSTLLYGLHGRVSPQPWVYLTPNHSFPAADSARVGATVVESLKAHNVGAIVIERLAENAELLENMPALQAWIRDEFELTKEFGFCEVWTRRTR